MGESGLATYVRERRLALGLTQVQLADAAGVTHPAISDIERGKTKLPGAQVRRPLAAALGVRHLDLMVAAGELTPQEAGEGTTPASARPEVERLCAALRRVEAELAADPRGLEVLRRAISVYEVPVVPRNPGVRVPAQVGAT